MVMSRDQIARRSHNIKNDNSPFARVFEYLENTLTNENSIQQTVVREYLLSFGAETFVFQFAIQKFED